MMSTEFKLQRVSGQPVNDDELLADLRRVAEMLGASSVLMPKYRQLGMFGDSNLAKRFGTWNNALTEAGLAISNEVNITDERLFENILTLWQHYGRQPRRSELSENPSTISQSPYNRRFSSWMGALAAFVTYANGTVGEAPPLREAGGEVRRTGRDPSLRLRWNVLQRDRFTCSACGSSPALSPGVELCVDHIVPWSKGGQTVQENLKTLCSDCNLGKSNTVECS